jgi:hypothetical protein
MSINLLFSNPQEKLTPINMNTWNALAGPGSTIAVAGTTNEINVNTQGGTATVSLPNSVVFPSSATVPILNVNNSYTMPSSIGTPGQILSVPTTGSTLVWANDIVGNVNSVIAGSPNMVINPTSGNVVVNLSESVDITTLTINNSYVMPSNIGTAGQVLSVPNSGSTLVWSSDAGGTVDSVTGSSNINVNPNTGNVVVNLSESVDITTLTINSSYVLPSTIGNVGDTLVVQSGTNVLEFAPNEGSGVTGLLNTDNQITLSGSTGNVTVGLADNIQVETLYINNGSADYFLPNVQGNVGDTMVIQSGSNQLIWAPNEGSGVTSLTSGQDGNINLDANTGNIIIGLSNAISVNGLTLNSKTFQNPTTGSPDQKLALDSNNNMVWINDTSGGVNSIGNTDNNIVFSAPTGTVTCALNSTVNIENLEVNSSAFQNPNSGNPNQSLTLNSSNNMVWTNIVNSISNTDTNISVSNPDGSVVLGLNSTVNIENLQINSKTFENPSLGSTGQVLVLDSNNNMVWGSDALGGVTEINNSDGNISVSNPTGIVTLDLATSIAVENITIGLAPNNYAMPSSIGTSGQILGITGTTVQWVNDTQGNFTVQGTENEINANTVNNVCTLSLPPIVSFPGDVYIGTGTLNSDNITNLNGISTGSLSCSGGLSMYNCNFQSPSLGTNGSVLTIDTSTNPFSLNWSNPTGQVTSVVGGVDGNILATPLTGTGNVVLTLGNTIEVTELDCQTINCQNTITSSVLNVGDEFLGSGFNYFGKSLQNPTNANAGSVLNLGPNNSMLWSDSPTLYDLNVNNQCTIDLLSVTTGIQFNGSNLGNPSTAAEGDILTIDANNNMIWATAPGVLSTSFNFEFLGSGNTMGLGNATIFNNNGIITLRFPFTTPQSYGKQIYIPAFTTGLLTCSSLPPPYRPINLITYTVPVIVPTLDLNNDPNGYLTSYTMTIQITTGGSIYLTLFQNIGANGPLPFKTNFIAGTPYMINSCYWGSPYNGDFTCTYPAIA